MGLKRFISWAKKTAKRKWEEKRARDHPFDLEKTYTESVHATEFNNSPKAPCNPYIARQNEIIEWRTRLRRYFQDDQWEFSALHLVFLTTILHHNFRLLRLVNWVEGVSTLVYHVLTRCRVEELRLSDRAKDRVDWLLETVYYKTTPCNHPYAKEIARRRDGYRCIVTGNYNAELTEIFPSAATYTVQGLAILQDALDSMLFAYDIDRNIEVASFMTSGLGCLDIPENLISLTPRLRDLFERGHIGFWWMGANPPHGTFGISDMPGPVPVPTPADFPALDEQAARRAFAPDALWTVYLQLAQHPRSQASAHRAVLIEDWVEELERQEEVTSGSTRLSECRLESSEPLESGHVFTMKVPYSQLDKMKMLFQVQWFCSAAFALAGGAGLEFLVDHPTWSEQFGTFDNACSEFAIPEYRLPSPLVTPRPRSFLLSEILLPEISSSSPLVWPTLETELVC